LNKFTLTQEESALMIIDIQERLVPAMPDNKKIIQNTNTIIDIANSLKIPIIVTEQYPKGLGNTILDINEHLDIVSVFEKTTFSGYTDKASNTLKQLGRKKIIITGMETHVCVFQTVRDLLANDYMVFVVGDAVCSRTKENYLNGLSLMSDMGAIITNTETVFFDIMKEAGTPLFKRLSKLIK